MCDEKKDEQECSFRGITPKIKEDRRELQIKLLKDSIVHIFCGLVRCRGTQRCVDIIVEAYFGIAAIQPDEPKEEIAKEIKHLIDATSLIDMIDCDSTIIPQFDKYIPNIITGRINIITKMFYNMSRSIFADEPTFRLLLPVNEALMDTENEWL